jgi:hypothetical protein
VVSVRGQGDIELGAGLCTWRLNKDELLLADEKNLKSFTAASGWRQTKQWTVDASEGSVFSPDGAEIVYSDSVVSGRNENGYPERTGRLCRLDLNAPQGSPHVLFSEYESHQMPCLWTRQGSILLYKAGFGVSLTLDGLGLLRIPAAGGEPRSLGITTLLYDDWSSLSPNHDALAICVGEGRDTHTDKRIAIVDLKSNAVLYLTDETTASIMPSWSPDGKLIAYSAAPEDEPSDTMNPEHIDQLLFRRRIWLADPAGVQTPRRLTGDDRYRDEKPMWLADGQHLLFCRVDGAKQRTLWMMRVDGTAPRQVAAALYADPHVFDVDYYGYTFWPGILDVYPGNHVSV